MTIHDIELKFTRPIWAKSIGVVEKCAGNDHHPYYWVDETMTKIKRVTSKRQLASPDKFDELTILKYYPLHNFQRAFFDELTHATNLEF